MRDAIKPMQRAAYDELRRKPGFHPWLQFWSTPVGDAVTIFGIVAAVIAVAWATAFLLSSSASAWTGCVPGVACQPVSLEQREKIAHEIADAKAMECPKLKFGVWSSRGPCP